MTMNCFIANPSSTGRQIKRDIDLNKYHHTGQDCNFVVVQQYANLSIFRDHLKTKIGYIVD